jgi:aspartate racemase
MNRDLTVMTEVAGDVGELSAHLSPANRPIVELTLQKKNGIASSKLTLPQRGNRDLAPLSFGQQRLWFLNQMDPSCAVYTTVEAMSITGVLNVEALQKALDAIVARHESLRTTFVCASGSPQQVIGEGRSVQLSIIELKDQPALERIRWLLKQEAERPFDLARDLMLRSTLFRLGQEEHLLLLMTHQIVFDRCSRDVLFRELGFYYGYFASGVPLSISPLPFQYSDYSSWQQHWVQDEALQEQLRYWQFQLSNRPTVLEVPTDHPRPSTQTFQGATQSRMLPNSLSEALKRLSYQEGCTLFMTMLAAFKALLYRYTGQEDIMVGTPIAGRNRIEFAGLIGSFVNTVVLRSNLSGDPVFRELLGQVKELAEEAYAHQDLPFEKLLEELRPERSLNHTPIFQVMFVLDNSPRQNLDLPGLNVSQFEFDRSIAKFDLTMEIVEKAEGLACFCEHNTDLFDVETVTRLLEHFQMLLEGVVANPDERVSKLPLLTKPERQQLLVNWNHTTLDFFPTDRGIHQLFEAQVERTPSAIAVVFEDQRLTYHELNLQANQLAHHLRKRGVGPDVLVGIYMERSLEMVVGLLGVLKAGGAYVPLDPSYPKERLGLMLEDNQLSIVLAQKRVRSNQDARSLETVFLDSEQPILAQESKENPVSETAPENLVCVLYTSGTTGKPKGVMITHGSLVNAYLAWEVAYQLRSKATCHLQMASFAFDVFTGDLVRALCSGAKLVLCPPLAPGPLYELMRQEKVDCAEFVPVRLRTLVRYLRETGQSLSFMRLLVVGSDSWHFQEYQEIESFCGPETRLINSYGVTEATVDSSYFETTRVSFPIDRFVPIGRPFANTQLFLLDSNLQPVPIGVPGELHVGGPGVARGYLANPELTAQKFIPNPFSDKPETRLYKTGDLARYLPDGNIEFLGRIDSQVKIRGFRIEAGEVETVLKQHPAVREALVMAREDELDGKRLVAYLATGRLPTPTITDLRKLLMQRLPEYMVPSAFVFMEALPRTPNGKLSRLALPEPDRTRPEIERALVLPRDLLELQLTKIWESVLGVKPIGVNDDFFELGGHSLLAVRLFAQTEKVFGKVLPLATLFQAPTIERLAEILRHEGYSEPTASLVPIQLGGHAPPFFVVHALGGHILGYRDLARHLGKDRAIYGLQAQGLDGGRTTHGSIKGMAKYYIKTIRAVLPEGPYLLGGYSLGGIVAFEMARQLQILGQEIALLALMDTAPPSFANLFQKAQSFCDQISYFAQRSRHHWGHLSSLGPRQQWDYIRQIKRRIWQTAVGSDADRQPSLPSILQMVAEANAQALEEYVPEVYPGRITLFRASNGSRRTCPDPDLAWGKLAAGGVEVHDVPGDHATMMEEPHVRILAEHLRACLSGAQVDRTTGRQQV